MACRRAQGKKQQALKRQSENTRPPPGGKPVVPRLPLPAFEDAEDLQGASRELMRL